MITNLAQLRERAKLTQVELARELGVTDHTIRNWEKGRSYPRLTIVEIQTLCSILNCSQDELAQSLATR